MKIKEEEESKLTTTDWKYAAMVGFNHIQVYEGIGKVHNNTPGT